MPRSGSPPPPAARSLCSVNGPSQPADGVFARTILDAVPYLAAGLAVSPLLLAVPSSWSLSGRFVVHLSLLVALGLAVSFRLAPRLTHGFFASEGWTPFRETLGAGIVLTVVVTGVVGLVTLASSAALRFDPSLQFLQLLSALDIAWAAAAVAIGAHHRWGRRAGVAGGLAVGVACVGSIWNYLRVVGFTEAGGWLVDGARLAALVISFDMVVAVVATLVLLAGVRTASADGAGE